MQIEMRRRKLRVSVNGVQTLFQELAPFEEHVKRMPGLARSSAGSGCKTGTARSVFATSSQGTVSALTTKIRNPNPKSESESEIEIRNPNPKEDNSSSFGFRISDFGF